MFFLSGHDVWRMLKCIKGKKVILYGTEAYAKEIIQKLGLMDIAVDYCVDDDFNSVKVSVEVRDVYSLLLEKEPFYVFIAKKDRKKCATILENMGFRFGENYNCINNLRAMHKPLDDYMLDVNCGYTLPAKETKGVGVRIFGDIQTAKYIVAILGGSTTDPCAYPWKSWGEFFWEYKKEEWAVVVGAVAGYSSSEEVIKLLRDILPLKPNLVISFSGVNDMNYRSRYINNYQHFLFNTLNRMKVRGMYGHNSAGEQVCYGMKVDVPYAERWISNQKIMCAITREFGIMYRAFFQPSMYTKCMGRQDEECFSYLDQNAFGFEKKCEYMKSVLELAEREQLSFIIDATHWLDEEDGLFYDHCHVEEQGNRIIAKKVYENLFGEGDAIWNTCIK